MVVLIFFFISLIFNLNMLLIKISKHVYVFAENSVSDERPSFSRVVSVSRVELWAMWAHACGCPITPPIATVVAAAAATAASSPMQPSSL